MYDFFPTHLPNTARSEESSMPTEYSIVQVERIQNCILLIRGQKVMLDRDLAALYRVETRALNQAVQRNIKRFPSDFMFELTREEIMGISQIVTSSDIKYSKRVRAFTEQGVAMLSSVLHSPRAVHVNIEIMRAFVKLRQLLSTHADLTRKLDELEGKYDAQFKIVFEAIRQLMRMPEPPRKQIGFQVRERNGAYRVRRNGGRHR
jgi:hypothetical protein